MDTFKKFYPNLLGILPVDVLTTQFFSKSLLSGNHKENLDGLLAAKATHRVKAKYFLDEVIAPGLKIGYRQLFDEMLAIMKDSDDPTVRSLANEILAPTGTHDQDTHSQGDSQAKLSPKPTYPELLEQLAGVVSWKIVAAHLLSDTDGSKVAIIEKSNHYNIEACRDQMIRDYLRSGQVSWEVVLEALTKAKEMSTIGKIKRLL